MRSSGSSRTFLLVALGASVSLVVAGGWFLASTGPPSPGEGAGDASRADERDDESGDELPPGAGNPHAGKLPRTGRAAKPGGDGEGGDEEDKPDYIREPEGAVFEINLESMKNLLAANEWEELRRQIDVYQKDGHAVPPEIVAQLFELLKEDGRRIDAMLALGLVRDDATGRLLAEAAVNAALPEEVRIAALQALAKSGQSAALPEVRRIVQSAEGDTKLVRQAIFALGAIGGPEGVKPLLAHLAAHTDDDQTDAVLTALAKSKGGDEALGQALRAARTAGDGAQVALLLKVGTRMGAASGPELRREIQALVANPTALAGMESDQEGRDRLRMSAIYVATAMGGDALDAVLQVAKSETGAYRAASLASLRNARGDDSARRILTMLTPDADPSTRYEVVTALGATESREATKPVSGLLGDSDGAVREAASSALAQIRDPASIPVLLAELDRIERTVEHPPADVNVARNLVIALGRIGAKDALPKLKALLDSKEQFWKDLEQYVRQAIGRIDTGNTESTRVR
jgi:HEAT repeat protein